MSNTINIGIVGMENWYHAFPFAHLIDANPNARLVAVSDDDDDRLDWIRERHPKADIRSSHASIIDDPAIDAVVINAATADHAALATAAAARKKHVLCDKPLEVSVAKAEEIVHAFHGTNLVFAAAFTRRPRPINRLIRRLIREGEIGDVLAAIEVGRFGFPRKSPRSAEPGWYGSKARAGFGGFADFGTHQIDMLRWMFGAEVTGVSGRLANLLHKVEEVDDYGVATLQFENGVIATVESSWVTHGPGTNALFIQGSAGSITLDDTLRVNTPKMTWEVKDTSKEYLSVHGINLRVDGFRQVLDNFVACVTGEESTPLASLDDAVAVTRVLEAVSLDSGKRGDSGL